MVFFPELFSKRTVILIEKNIGVIFFKLVQIIGWWTDTDYYKNRKICIIESSTNIQKPGSESMNIHYRIFYSEVVSI